MGTFHASLRAIGDVNAVPATLDVDEGRLSIAAGETEIGSWQLTDIQLEPIPTGYRLAAEGDQIIIEMEETDSFAEAVSSKTHDKLLKRARKSKSSRPEGSDRASRRARPAVPADPLANKPKRNKRIRVSDHESAATVSPPDAVTHTAPPAPMEAAQHATTKPKKTLEQPGFGRKALDRVDDLLIKSNKRFGAYLPSWVFTRGVFGALVLALVLALLFPGQASVILLILGAVGIIYGAVAYSDPMLASRWLPGRTTPPQVLITGLGILLVGILLGMLAG